MASRQALQTGGTIAFKCDSPERVHSFHDTAVAHGGVSIENPPGLRKDSMGCCYLVYVRDPGGHKFRAIHRVPSWSDPVLGGRGTIGSIAATPST